MRIKKALGMIFAILLLYSEISVAGGVEENAKAVEWLLGNALSTLAIEINPNPTREFLFGINHCPRWTECSSCHRRAYGFSPNRFGNFQTFGNDEPETAPVPAPPTLILVGAGCLAFIAYRRRAGRGRK